MSKTLLFGTNAKEKILNGVSKLENAVSITLGPCGKNVIIDEFGTIHSTKDGVTVAKSIVLKDKFENIGANAIKEVANKSNINVGDGTTTSTILAAEIYKAGLKFQTMGLNPTLLKTGIKLGAEKIVEFLKKISTPISEQTDIERVATVSANGDKKIGSTIAEIMSKLGKDGLIKVENGNTTDITSKIVEGMVIDKTFVSPYMISDTKNIETELNNCFILIVDKKITNIQEILPCMQTVSAKQGSLLIIAEDYQDDVLATLVMNKLHGFNLVAIKSPSFGMNQKNILQDIAILCGCSVVSSQAGINLTSAVVGSKYLGMAKRVVCNKDSTMIFGGSGNKDLLKKRVEDIRNQIEKLSNDNYDKLYLQDRLAKLTTGIGIISVGGVTETELKEKRDRVDDAFSAAKAAIKNGVVIGGGAALIYAKQFIDDWISKITNEDSSLEYDVQVGCSILYSCLDLPCEQLLKNAGIENSSLIISKINEIKFEKKPIMGYNILTKKITDLFEDGILDPTDVVINEILNSASVSGLLLTTDCLIVEDEKPSLTNNM